MKKITVLVLIFSMLFQNAYGAVYKVISDETIEFDGMAKANSLVSVSVLKPGKEYADMEMHENKLDIFAAYKEYQTDETGAYTVSFKLSPENCISGIYLVRTGTEDMGLKTDQLYYINKTKHEQSCKDFFAAEDKEEYIMTYLFDLGLNYELINDENVNAILRLYDESKSDILDLSENNISEILNKCAAINGINESEIEIFGDYSEDLGFSSDVLRFLDKSYLVDIYSIIEEKISRSSGSLKDFDKNLNIALALACVQAADGYGTVKEALTAFSDDLGISRSKITDDVCKEIVGRSLTKEQLEKELDAFDDNGASGNGGGNSYGGGGGSAYPSGNRVAAVQVSEELIEPPVLEPYVGAAEFSDLSGFEWAEEAIENLRERNIVSGKEEGRFCPEQRVLREEFVKMVMEGLQFADLYGEFELQDVKESDWYYSWVKNAYLSGIVNGVSEQAFGSGQEISRQDMAVIIYNALNKKGIILENASSREFGDELDISGYAAVAVSALSGTNIIQGDEAGNFNPTDSATRAEAAVIINNVIEYMEGNSHAG